MPTRLRDRILQHRRENPKRREFADRLLEGIERIEREFSGAERDRLLALARRTFERHIRSARRTDEMRVALEQLHKDHERLIGILERLCEPSAGRTLH
jgi:phosphoglycolate phosphatase-like HAD superfamily hydrolase